MHTIMFSNMQNNILIKIYIQMRLKKLSKVDDPFHTIEPFKKKLEF